MKKRFLSLALTSAMLISAVSMTQLETSAATTTGYYNGYSTISTVSNIGGATAMQGMGADDTYLYAVKIKPDESKAYISKTHRLSKSTTILRDSETGLDYFTGLGHANGVDTVTIDGKTNLLVASMHDDTNGLVRLVVDGDKATAVAKHTVKYNGTAIKATGVAVIANDGENMTLLFKRGEDFYKGTLAVGAGDCDINVKLAFKTDKSAVTINGKTEDITAYINQGFGYYDNKIFVPMWSYDDQNLSVVIVYDIKDAGPADVIPGDKNLSFRITSGTYKTFEIEDVAISGDGKLYFNTNLVKGTDNNYDGVHCFSKYTAFDANEAAMGKKYTVKYSANGGSGKMSNTTVEYGTKTALSSNRFTKTNYGFTGWYAKRSSDSKWAYIKGSTVKWYKEGKQPSGYSKRLYTNNGTVSGQSSVANDTVTLYAQWVKTYRIMYSANGGSGTMPADTVNYGATVTLDRCEFTKEGSTFKGWYIKRASDGKWAYSKNGTIKWYREGSQASGYKKHLYADGASVKNLCSTAGDLVKPFAQWT